MHLILKNLRKDGIDEHYLYEDVKLDFGKCCQKCEAEQHKYG